jgi:hypothetical protein
MTDDQSGPPRAPSPSSTARRSRRLSPAFVQAENRRCAVTGETPNVGGRCRHAHPLVSTYTAAVHRPQTGRPAQPRMPRANCGCGSGIGKPSRGSGSPSGERAAAPAVTDRRVPVQPTTLALVPVDCRFGVVGGGHRPDSGVPGGCLRATYGVSSAGV